MRAHSLSAVAIATLALAACASPDARPDETAARDQAATSASTAEAATDEVPGYHGTHPACPMTLPGTTVELQGGEGTEVVLVFSNQDVELQEALHARVQKVATRMESHGIKLMAMQALAGGGEGKTCAKCAHHQQAAAEGKTCAKCAHHQQAAAEGKTCAKCAHHQQAAAEGKTCAKCAHHQQAAAEGKTCAKCAHHQQAAAAHGHAAAGRDAIPPMQVDTRVEAEGETVRLVLTAQEKDHAGFLVDEMQWRVMKMQEGRCPMQPPAN